MTTSHHFFKNDNATAAVKVTLPQFSGEAVKETENSGGVKALKLHQSNCLTKLNLLELLPSTAGFFTVYFPVLKIYNKDTGVALK